MTKDSAGIAAPAAPGGIEERRLRRYLATMADALGESPLRRPLILLAAGIFAVILAYGARLDLVWRGVRQSDRPRLSRHRL